MNTPDPTLAPRASVDPAGLLRLSSVPARVVLGLYVASNLVFVIASADTVASMLPVIVAFLLIVGAALLLLRDQPDPFPIWLTLGVIGAVTASTALVSWQLPAEGAIGRAAWHLGANAWLLFFLALRRRTAMAWLGHAAMVGVTVAWCVDVGRGALWGVLQLDAQTALLLVGSLFALNLRRTARRIDEIDAQSVQAAAEAAEAATATAVRSRRVAELRESTGPLLQALAEHGAPSDEASRQRYALAEAALRDGVRGRSLMRPSVAEAAAAARKRGVDVDLLDDRGHVLATADAMDRMVAAIVASLEAAASGTVTVRLAPSGRDVALSIVSAAERETVRVGLDADGQRVDALA